jgi:hypothetical protein
MKSVIVSLALIVISSSVQADTTVYESQKALKALGYEVGAADGSFGPKSSAGFRQFCIDHSLPTDDTLDASDLVKLRFLARSSFPIPNLTGTDYSPREQPKVITDVVGNQYPACSDTYSFSRMGRITSTSAILTMYRPFLGPDFYQSFPNWQMGTADQPTIDFSDTIFNLHHRCLAGETAECKAIIDIVTAFAENNAQTRNHDPLAKTPGAELYFQTIHRILVPLITAYSSAIQVMGRPANHGLIGEWAYNAIIQNTYNPFAPVSAQNRDFFRGNRRASLGSCPDLRAQNHSLQSAYLASAYGAIWGDPAMFSLAFDSLSFTLGSIRSDGSLRCEATRGANAIMYSGGTLSTILQILYLAKLHGIDFKSFENIERIHDAARFLVDASQNMDLINKYAQENFVAWCDDDYRKQCIDTPFGRMIGFGWIRPYKLLFPDHPNIGMLDDLADEMSSSENMDQERKIVLSAILKSAYPVVRIQKNLVDDRSYLTETYTTVFEDAIEWNRGSPYCLYTVQPK